LVARYQGLVWSTALGVGLDRDDAADVFQYVWVELHRSLPRFRHAVALPRWLMVATRRNAYKVAAQRRRVVHETFEDMTDPAALADAQVEAAEGRRQIETALAALDERCRDFVRLFFLEPVKASYEKIAAEANLAIGSIGPTRARCLQKLRRALGARR
jgi:RNA polymerase sigma factor (sigma-70 family)